jgi:hypothetical protein
MGARISLSGGGELPKRMMFQIHQLGEERAARLAWQLGRDAGLAFEA